MSIKGFIINSQTVKYNYPDLDNLPSEPSGGGVTEALKTALLQIASKVAYIDDDGADYYQDLYDALYSSVTTYTITNNLTSVTNSNAASTITENSSYTATLSCAADYEITSVTITMGGNDVTGTSYSSGTISIANVTGNIVITAVATQRQATLSSIDAVFSQGQTVIYTNTPLNDLKQYLVVTATWSDTSTSTVPSADYTLSGTLTVGTSTITVSYGGKTDTFTVTVTEAPLTYLYNWDLTQSLVDSVASQEITLGAGSGVSNATRNSNGLSFDAATQYAYLGTIEMPGKTVELDISSFDFKGNTNYHIRLFMNGQYNTVNGYGLGALIWRNGTGWASYGWSSDSGTSRAWSASCWSADLTGTSTSIINAFNGKTVKIVYHSDGHTQDLYVDGTLKGTLTDIYFNKNGSAHLSDKIYIGGCMSVAQNSGDQCYDMTITGIRIYENNE